MVDAASFARHVPRLRSLLQSRDALAAYVVQLESQRDELALQLRQAEAALRDLSETLASTQALLGRHGPWPPGHFYSPIPDPQQIERDGARLFDQQCDSVAGVELGVDRQLDLLTRLVPFSQNQPFPDRPDGLHRYYFDNDWFGPGDAIIYHCLLRYLRPRRVVEVGIGFSSALLLDTNEGFLDGSCNATFIDPNPERMVELLGSDDQDVRIIAEPVQNVGVETFATLTAGDILFIDSSHVTKAGSDVNVLYFDVIPHLASGVYVHIHDIFWPFEYPRHWVLEGRAWNEDYLVRAYLTDNEHLEIVWFNDYLGHRHRDQVSTALPKWDENPGGSLWLRVR
jgi:Methyltransferase domain